MATQLTTRGPVQVREFIPDAASAPTYQERAALVNRVKIHERGPDITVDVFRQNLRIGTLTLPSECEALILARLFGEGDPVPPSLDREILGKQIDAHEEACMAGDTLTVTHTRRVLWTYLTALLTDHEELVRLKAGERGAA